MFPGIATLLGLAFAIVPGFVASAAWSRSRTWKGPPGDVRLILQSLVWSIVIQGALLPVTLSWIYPIREELAEHPGRVTSWVLLSTVAVPLLAGAAVGRLTDYLNDPTHARVEGRMRRTAARFWPAPALSVWDTLFTFEALRGKFLVVTFNDGSRVAGSFDSGSVATTSPEPHGVFLATEWDLDEHGDIIGPIPDSGGIMIRDANDVRTIRVLEV